MNTWICIPTYNEAENLPLLLAKICQVASQNPAHKFSVLIVDDNSPDGTAEIAEDYDHAGLAALKVMRRAGKDGLANAYKAGFAKILADENCDCIVSMDADMSHDPVVLPRMLELIAANDVVVGSRYIAGGSTPDWPLRRRMISRIGNLYAGLILRCKIYDLTGGYNCYSASALRLLDLAAIKLNGYAFQIFMKYSLLKSGCKVIETPIVFNDRRHGQSKLGSAIIAEAIIAPWRM